MKKKTIKLLVKLSLILFLIGLLSIEIYLRIYSKEKLIHRKFPLIYQSDTLSGYTYIPNTDTEIIMPSIVKKVHINNLGFYGPDYPEKKEGTMRIAIVGTSQTTGLWMQGDEPFALGLQKKFKEEKMNIEVINCGIDGIYRDLENVYMIYNKIMNLKPDLILLEAPQSIPIYYRNHRREIRDEFLIEYKGDDPDSRRIQLEHYEKMKSKYWFPIMLYDYSYIARSVFRHYFFRNRDNFAKYMNFYDGRNVSITAEDDNIWYKFTEKSTIELYKELNDHLENNNIKFLVFNYHVFGKYQRSFFKKTGINMLNLGLYAKEYDFSLEHKHDSHFNQKAHHIISNLLYNELIENKNFQDLYTIIKH